MPRRHPSRDAAQRRGRRPAGPRPVDPAVHAEREARRRAVCAAKDRYASEAEARAFALMHQPGPGRRASAYPCEVCGGWHLTSRS
ncbi:hypothetical protein [Patulibacter sp. SYSU D01012]|uniref:hypothetical protein n=1 Tax=Patulibacter sp. SYSU D01012 TaxID=2817381 RepID=UPI001B30C5AB|nr:hypothetical protein [Patulibacter sp. SYSU D01012]